MKKIKHTIYFLSLFVGGLLLITLGCATKKDANGQSGLSLATPTWPHSTPQSEGIDPTIITSLHQDISTGKYGLIDHFLFIRNGKIVADHAYEQDYEKVAAQYDTTNHQYNYDHPAWHPFYNGTKLHSLQSVTKSITSAALGIAIDEGYLSGVAIKVMPLFKEYKMDLTDPRRQNITLEDLLTMRSGIEWDESNYSEVDNSCIVMELSDDWIQYVLDQPMDADPGTQFEYNSGASVLIGKIIHLTTGKRADKWAEEKLFGPLGITDYYWKRTPKGEIDTEGGLYLSSHDLAKIGYLFLHKGKWGDQQVISEQWVEKSTSPVIPGINPGASYNPGYGYQWWVPEQKDGKTTIFAGNGYGGQFVMVAPAYNIVSIFNGWNIHDRPEKFTYNALQRVILPAIK